MSPDMASSAGGEHPKFTAFTGGRHVLVKFAQLEAGAAAERWGELLSLEALALQLLSDEGFSAAQARVVDRDGFRFLEVNRFDRVGARGRRAMVSLFALDNEYFGVGRSWATLARRMQRDAWLQDEDARRVRLLDAFGALIANTDRHLGNLSFLPTGPATVALAPIYDMLPMAFAPVGATLVDREIQLPPPTADTFDVWPEAARLARQYWERALDSTVLKPQLRQHAKSLYDQLPRV